MKNFTIKIITLCLTLIILLSPAAGSFESEPAISYASASVIEAEIDAVTTDFNNGSVIARVKQSWENGCLLEILMFPVSLNCATSQNIDTDSIIFQDDVVNVFRNISTLVNGYKKIKYDVDSFHNDSASPNQFVNRSSAATIKHNISYANEGTYSRWNHNPPVSVNYGYMTVQDSYTFPVDRDSEGSSFFVIHSSSDDNMPEETEEDELPYWNGLDFGPNLSYEEEYKSQGDPGDYLNPAEAAKQTFESVKHNGYIPGYSDATEYTMTLVDLTDVNGEECYVYRFDGGGFAAGFAYAYQSGTVYMQGQGGQWVPLEIGDGDPR
jgi:hypothetical protein